MDSVADVFAKPISQQLLSEQVVAQLAYTGLDGAPRVIPIGYVWDGTSFLMWTIPISAKVRALTADPRVAINVDTMGTPPRILSARGLAELSTEDGVPDGYLEASHRTMPREAWDGFDEQVRGLYDSMVQIRVTPTWAKLIDFETNAPAAVEKLMQQKAESAGA